MPLQFRPDPQPRVLDDEIVGHGLARPHPVPLMVELSRPGGQRPHPVLEISAQDFRIEVAAHGQGEIDGVRLQPDLLERLGPQGPQFAMPLAGDAVDGPRGKLAVLLGSQRLDQALGRQPVQRTVQRPGPDLGPQLGPVERGVPAQLVTVHRPVLRQRAQDEQPGRIHPGIKTRVLKYDYPSLSGHARPCRAMPAAVTEHRQRSKMSEVETIIVLRVMNWLTTLITKGGEHGCRLL